MMGETITEAAETYLDGVPDAVQDFVMEATSELSGTDRTHSASVLVDLLTETGGELVIRVQNAGATPYFRWCPDAEQFERIIIYSAPQSKPKHHRETPRSALETYLNDCAPYTIQITTQNDTPFPDYTAVDWVYKWPRHENERCVYGVVTDTGMETWYFEQANENPDDTGVELVSVERWLGDDSYSVEEINDEQTVIELPDRVRTVLEENRFTYSG